jgi:hypothetical protein
MNGLLIVFAAAFLLFLPLFNNVGAAGSYDGEWTGTATSTGARCKQAAVKFTVKGRDVSGQARFERDTPNINGTVAADGAVGATVGFLPLWGQFTGDDAKFIFSIRSLLKLIVTIEIPESFQSNNETMLLLATR